MARKDFYMVPASERVEFDRMIQRANRRIKSSLKYIQKEDIKSDATKRSLVGDYGDPTEWVSEKTVFSRSKKFSSEKEYKDFVRHVQQWGSEGSYERSEESIKEGYYKNIIKALTTTALDNGNGVLTKKGQLPGNLAKKIKNLSLEQMTNFFDHGDPTETIESMGFDSFEYVGVDRGEFVDITMAHLNALTELYPDNQPVSHVKEKKSSNKRKKKRGRKKTRRKRK